jgi:hypothetical protein
MAKELLWKRAVRRGIEHARREPRTMNFGQTCALSAYMIECLRHHVAGGEQLSEEEINRRVALYHLDCERLERRLAESWRKVWVSQ